MEKTTVKDIEIKSIKLQMITNIFLIIFCIMSFFTMSLAVIHHFSKTDETKTVEIAKPVETTKPAETTTTTDKKDETAKPNDVKDETTKPTNDTK